VQETEYRAYAVAPIILVTFTAIFLMVMCYYSAYEHIKKAEAKRTSAAGTYARRPLSRFVAFCRATLGGGGDRASVP
jgi:hypothetical protein